MRYAASGPSGLDDSIPITLGRAMASPFFPGQYFLHASRTLLIGGVVVGREMGGRGRRRSEEEEWGFVILVVKIRIFSIITIFARSPSINTCDHPVLFLNQTNCPSRVFHSS